MIIDLHMHSTASDGSDVPEDILSRVTEAGIRLFSLTDHDTAAGIAGVRSCLTAGSPAFVNGIELSTRDGYGKYHILGYGFDQDAAPLRKIIAEGHENRILNARERIRLLKQEYGFRFRDEAVGALLAMDNPGRPHIGRLLVSHGYAASVDEAIRRFINRLSYHRIYIRPEEGIRGILESGGIPVLAHPIFGSGEEMITGADMEARLRLLTGFGLQGVEAFYSAFLPEQRQEMLDFADRFGLYVTAGSDYHGRDRQAAPGQTGLDDSAAVPDGLLRFLEDIQNLDRKSVV